MAVDIKSLRIGSHILVDGGKGESGTTQYYQLGQEACLPCLGERCFAR